MMHGYGLIKLMEECGELTRVAAKMLVTEGGAADKNLAVSLEDALAAVLAASTFTVEKRKLDAAAIVRRTESKLTRLRKGMQ
jgi:NTP pyrophosphatase (non-canonical NTP hydrolase)